MASMPGAEGNIDQQKAALLAVLASQGRSGAVAYDQNAAAVDAGRQQAIASIAQQANAAPGSPTPAALTAQLNGQANALSDIYANDNRAARSAYDASMSNISNANAAYMDQARAAIPVVRAQTDAQIARIRAEQQAAEEQRQWAREQHQWDVEDRKRQEDQQQADDVEKFKAAAQADVARRVQVHADGMTAAAFNTVTGVAKSYDEAIAYVDRRNAANLHDDVEGNALRAAQVNALKAWLFEYYNLEPKSAADARAADAQAQGAGAKPGRVPAPASLTPQAPVRPAAERMPAGRYGRPGPASGATVQYAPAPGHKGADSPTASTMPLAPTPPEAPSLLKANPGPVTASIARHYKSIDQAVAEIRRIDDAAHGENKLTPEEWRVVLSALDSVYGYGPTAHRWGGN